MTKRGNKRGGEPKVQGWLKRQAVQVTGMLPENPDDARAVLAYSRKLVDFMDKAGPALRVVGEERPT